MSTIFLQHFHNIVKMGCTYHFLKKKKKIVAIVAMPLPKWEEKKNSLRQWHCRNRGYKFLAIVAMALSK